MGGGRRRWAATSTTRRAARRRRARPRAGPPVRRRQPRDQGARRRRAGARAGRPRRRGHGAARRGDGAGLRPGRRHRDARPSRCARSSPPATSPPTSSAPASWADAARDSTGSSRSARRSGLPVAATATACRPRCSWSSGGGARPRRCSRGAQADFEAVDAGAELASRHRPRRPAHPPGPARRRRGAAARQGPVRCRRCCPRPACTWPAATTTSPAPRPAAGCARIGDDRLRAVELLTVLVDAELAPRRPRRRVDAACAELAERTRRSRRPGAAGPRRRGPGPRARGRRRRSTGAIAMLEASRRPRSIPAQLPWLRVDAAHRARAPARRGRRHGRARPSTPRPRPRRSRRSTSSSPPRRRAARPPVPGRAGAPRARRARRRWPATAKWWMASSTGTSVRLPDTKGLALPRRARRPSRRRAPRPRSGRPRRGRRRPTATRPPAARRRRRAARRRARGSRTGTGSSSCGPRSTTRSRPGSSRPAEAKQAELDQLVAQLARPSASAGATAGGLGRRAGPPQRDPGAAGGDRQAGRGAARRRRGARPPGPHRPLLRVRARPTTTRFAGSFSPE